MIGQPVGSSTEFDVRSRESRGHYRATLRGSTNLVQGWPKLWANVKALIGIFSQSVGPSLAIWASPVNFTLSK